MITFHTDGRAAMPDLNYRQIIRWIEAVAESYDRHIGDINYIFVDDAYILEINRRFLEHDYYTDIITFDYTLGRILSGDLYISLDTVDTNAVLVGSTYKEELLRVVIHGILHLCGINDKGPGEREQMEAAEDKALTLLQSITENESINNLKSKQS